MYTMYDHYQRPVTACAKRSMTYWDLVGFVGSFKMRRNPIKLIIRRGVCYSGHTSANDTEVWIRKGGSLFRLPRNLFDLQYQK